MSDRLRLIRGAAALDPEPEPEPELVPVVLDYRDLRGPSGPRRIYAPDAPAAWRGQVTLTVGCYAVTLPEPVVDVCKYGPPLADLYLTDDEFRAVIGRKLDQQMQQAHDDQNPARMAASDPAAHREGNPCHGRSDRPQGPTGRD